MKTCIALTVHFERKECFNEVMKYMKIFLILVVTVFGLWSSVLGFWSGSKTVINNAGSVVADKSAQELYAQNCARCHGADGRGQTEAGKTYDTPDIADAKWQRRHSDKKIAGKISKGGGGMPAFGKKLSQKESNELVRYVRTLKK